MTKVALLNQVTVTKVNICWVTHQLLHHIRPISIPQLWELHIQWHLHCNKDLKRQYPLRCAHTTHYFQRRGGGTTTKMSLPFDILMPHQQPTRVQWWGISLPHFVQFTIVGVHHEAFEPNLAWHCKPRLPPHWAPIKHLDQTLGPNNLAKFVSNLHLKWY